MATLPQSMIDGLSDTMKRHTLDLWSGQPERRVLDDLSADISVAAKLGTAKVRTLLHQGKHLIFDRPSAARVVEMVEKHADLICDLMPFALRPFEKMTISLPIVFPVARQGELLMLIDGNDLGFVIRDDQRPGGIAVVPGWYWSVHEKGGAKRTILRVDDKMEKDDELNKIIGTYTVARDAAFLLLNQTRGIHIAGGLPARKTISRGKPVTYFGRSTVTISLDDPIRVIQRHYATLARSTPRRHGVRGHFVHRGGDMACIHDWQELVDRPRQAWECPLCGRRRFWRKEFERGDAGKGFVHQKYEVTSKGD